MQKPYLNLGAGRVILPGERPFHHSIINPAIYDYPLWLNVDRNDEPGVDEVVDLFAYPWPWLDNSFDGALLSHLVEHIPHEIRIVPMRQISGCAHQLQKAQDGWYAFFAELHRVLTPGAQAHILCPYGWSAGAITDPTHTRLVTEHTFTHSMQPNPDAPFFYETLGLNFAMVGGPAFRVNELFQHLLPIPEDNEVAAMRKSILLREALMTRINVAYDLSVVLEAVKDEADHRVPRTDEGAGAGGEDEARNPLRLVGDIEDARL